MNKNLTNIYMFFLGSDHAGFRLKETIKNFLTEQGFNCIDLGNKSYDPEDDYPDYGYMVASKVAETGEKGILFCGNAEGICIVANKVDGIRAALGYNEYAARTSRQDDDSNILCLPGRVLNAEEAKNIVMEWINTEFSNEDRHQRRINKIKELEETGKLEGLNIFKDEESKEE